MGKRNISYKILFLTAFFILFFLASSHADDTTNKNQNMPQGEEGGMPPIPQEGQSGHREMKAPPQQAIDACVGKKPGDTCQLQRPQGNKPGEDFHAGGMDKNQNITQSNNENMPPESQKGQGPHGDRLGVCEYTPDKKYFACRPSDMGPKNKRPDNQQGSAEKK